MKNFQRKKLLHHKTLKFYSHLLIKLKILCRFADNIFVNIHIWYYYLTVFDNNNSWKSKYSLVFSSFREFEQVHISGELLKHEIGHKRFHSLKWMSKIHHDIMGHEMTQASPARPLCASIRIRKMRSIR